MQQVELCQHLEAQLSSLRAEHESSLNQIKEGHVLLERHVENTNRSMQNEVSLSVYLSFVICSIIGRAEKEHRRLKS